MFKNKNGCFDCDNCPQTNDRTQKRFCVAWAEFVETNRETKEVRVKKDCGIPQLFRLLIENSAAADRVTANLTSLPSRFKQDVLPAMRKLKLNG